jgi:hypothetical protein
MSPSCSWDKEIVLKLRRSTLPIAVSIPELVIVPVCTPVPVLISIGASIAILFIPVLVYL